MKISFVTTNNGKGCLGLVNTDAEQITTLSGDGTCYGWELDLENIEEHVEIVAVEDTDLFITNNSDADGGISMKIVDDENKEVTILRPGKRYPSEGSHELKGQTGLKISLVEPEYVAPSAIFKSSLLGSLTKNAPTIPGLTPEE